MSTDLFTPRSSSMATRDFGSTFSCSSSEASSRLAARLERSEYKRTRAKQRLNSSSRSHCRRRDSKGSRKKNAVSSTRETRTKSEENGVTSVWEVYRQNPYYYSDRTASNKPDKKENRNTWYGMPSSSQPSQRRPQSIHIGSSDYSNLEYHSWSPGKQRPKNSFDDRIDHSLEQRNKTHNSHYNTKHSPTYMETQHPKEIQGDYSLGKNGMYLSRSLSSSFSSYVGSSDEKEDSQGIYSAYDIASRSPYESMLSRRYSQSSLSSSNASWHQHQSPSLNYNIRDIPPLLDPPASKSHQMSNSKSPKFSSHKSDLREEFQVIQESSPPAVPPKPKKYSSSYTIQLHSSKKEPSNKSDFSRGSDQNDNKGPSVREMAKKFTPISVRHISSVYSSPLEDMNRAKTENWVKTVAVPQQESSPSFEKIYNESSSPPRSLHSEDKNWGVVLRQKDKSNKSPEELASHRLSLQELIQLHEEQIAIQAKSAKTIPAHAFTKRSPPCASSSPQNRFDFDSKGTKTIPQLESPKAYSGKPEPKSEKLLESFKTANFAIQKEHSDYEVREVVVSQSSPFKVIELTDKAVDSPKGRLSRLKRHRTIGIVGYRQQIDRTSGRKPQTKQKRHTTVGIVSDFTDSSTEVLSKSQELPTKQDHSFYPLSNSDAKHVDITASNSKKLDLNNTKPFPVKIFDIEDNSDQTESHTVEAQESHQNDQFKAEVAEQVASVSAECWFSGVSKDKDFLEFQRVEYSPATPESTDKEDGLLSSSTTVEPQQDLGLSASSTTEKFSSTFQDTPSRHSHSPVVELVPERKGNPTAYYKTTPASHSHLKKPLLDTSKELSPSNLHNFGMTKTYPVPVAQVSPVSQSLGSQEILEPKAAQVGSPPPLPPSAHELYETRLAMWDLLPHQERSSGDLSEPLSNEGHLLFGDHSKDSSHHSKDMSPPKFVPPTFENRDMKGSNFSLNFQRLNKTEEYYFGVIEKLNVENQRLKEKYEEEKKEFRRMYEEQKKVANAYQKLEDRYRRRVHELQDALASCTCQGSLMVKESNHKSSHLKNEKESHTSKLQSSKSGMHMFEELEEWLSEQSKNSKTPKANTTSRDSLISSSSDLTGTGWDEHCDVYGGDIDEVNGTHV